MKRKDFLKSLFVGLFSTGALLKLFAQRPEKHKKSQWHHFVVNNSGKGEPEVYIDGKRYDEFEWTIKKVGESTNWIYYDKVL